MKTTIKDLPRNEQMDSRNMATIRGGISVLNNVVPNLRMKAPPASKTPVGGVIGGDGGSGSDYDTGNSPVSFGNDPSGDGGSGGYMGDGSNYRPF